MARYNDGAYASLLDDEGEDRVRAGYSRADDRLAVVRRQFDRGNVFRLDPNVRPT